MSCSIHVTGGEFRQHGKDPDSRDRQGQFECVLTRVKEHRQAYADSRRVTGHRGSKAEHEQQRNFDELTEFNEPVYIQLG